eukprot:GHVS01053142.1.p1 GENE.GHVS01053142.1~~GHVS01053142.1.p1  ORF type:complete len:452 (+),score=72.56 GHVS01053142.1:88-1443(+)
MAYVNIPRDRDDPNYRYKMPKLYSKIEGRGNGIKTNISNMGEIAKALKRPPMYPTKFFGCELGAQCKYEEAEEKSLVNGAHHEKDLVEILDKFISMYVLCPGCQLPEMDIVVKKGMLGSLCNACGCQSDLDMTHKAATYMIRNPPDQTVSTVGARKKTKEERRADKVARHQRGSGDCLDGDDAEVEAATEKRKKEKKKKKEKDEKSGKVKKNKSRDMSEDEREDAPSPSESDKTPMVSHRTPDGTPKLDSDGPAQQGEEVKKKKKKKGVDGEKLQFNDDLQYDSQEIGEVVERLRQQLYESNSKHARVTPTEFSSEVRLLQVAQDFDAKVRLFVVLAALFGESLTADSFESKLPFIKKEMESNKCTELLEVVEYFINEVCGGKPLAEYPYIIQKMYKHHILETDEILKHYKREDGDPNFEKCRKAAEPVLTWLDENDTEEYDSSADEIEDG